MSTYQISQQSACEQEIFRRLNTAVQPGMFLDTFAGTGNKLRVFDYPQQIQSGESDLPQLCVLDWSNEDEYFAGALKGSGTDANRFLLGNMNMKTSCVLDFALQVSRLRGMFQKSGTGVPGLADWTRAIADVIQTQVDQTTKDANLNGNCQQPCKISAKNTGVKDTIWAVQIEVKYWPSPTLSGTRSDMVSVQTYPPNS